MFHLGNKFPAKGDVKYSRYIVVYNKKLHSWGIIGDHLITHLQCNICCFLRVNRRDPMSHILEDDILLWAIKISTLDELWS